MRRLWCQCPGLWWLGRDHRLGVNRTCYCPNETWQISDIPTDIRNLPDVFPVRFDETAAVPIILPVVVDMGPQVDDDPDVLLTGRDMEVDDVGIGRDIRILMDVCPMMFDESATVSLSLPVVIDTETQVDVRWASTSAVVPLVDGSGRPAG